MVRGKVKIKVKGRAGLYFETGMEGCEWVVAYQNPKTSKYYIHPLQNGDKLTLYNRGKEIWAGTIKHNTKINLTNDTGYSYPRQVVKNWIVHWLQDGINPDKWANWLIKGKDCELESRVKDEWLVHTAKAEK